MYGDIRNIFISHVHEDDEGVASIKSLLDTHGMTSRNGSITLDKFNTANNESYIKYQILTSHINWASVLVVYVSPDTKYSDWVNWEIEYARKQGKRIVGVWQRGDKGCDLPEALDRYADAIVGWNGESIIAAINGTFNGRSRIDASRKSGFESFIEEWGFPIALGLIAGTIYLRHTQSKRQVRVHPLLPHEPLNYYGGFRY